MHFRDKSDTKRSTHAPKQNNNVLVAYGRRWIDDSLMTGSAGVCSFLLILMLILNASFIFIFAFSPKINRLRHEPSAM